ncbi:hypothetical protein ACA910_007769 [Epithemia clementina (nom. ined.)]
MAQEKNNDDALVLELGSEIVLPLTSIAIDGNDDIDDDAVRSGEWMDDLPHYKLLASKCVAVADPPSKISMPDSLQSLIARRLLLQSNDAGNKQKNERVRRSSSLVVRGVILIGLHLLYGDLVPKCRWIQHALTTFTGSSRCGEHANKRYRVDSQLSNGDKDENCRDADNDKYEDLKEQLALWETLPETKLFWNEIMDVCSFANWAILLACIARHVSLFSLDHPLLEYAKTVLPTLSDEEARIVMEKLDLPRKTSSSFLAIAKSIHDKFSSSELIYVVLLDPDESKKLLHSCIPNACIQVNPAPSNCGKLFVKASAETRLCNAPEEDEAVFSVCRIEDGAVEEREQQLLLLTGRSCACLRCQYEVSSATDLLNHPAMASNTNTQDLMTLSYFYLGSKQDLNQAEKLFRVACTRDAHNLDALHALGAIELARNRFLNAQKLWHQAKTYFDESYATPGAHDKERVKNVTISQPHDGLKLQWIKLEAYGYLSASTSKQSPSPSSCLAEEMTSSEEAPTSKLLFQTVAPNVFRAHVVAKDICCQIIQWADSSNKWTKQRHYAVPTNDIPVHAVSSILEWFRLWFAEAMCPMLARQFGTTSIGGTFYPHDAFVVRYDSAMPLSNYLPLHTDESTHSFILALNDEYCGGGTYLVEHDLVIRLEVGEVLSFRGDLVEHGGEPVTGGTRYILAGFLYHDQLNDDQKKQPFKIITSDSVDHDFTFGFQILD